MLAGTGTDAGGRLMCADIAGFVGVCGTDGGGNVGFYAKQIVHKSQPDGRAWHILSQHRSQLIDDAMNSAMN